MEKINNQKFIKVIAAEGYVLTTYKEGDDIREFNYFSEGALPLSYNIDDIREIPIAEAEALDAQAREAIESDN